MTTASEYTPKPNNVTPNFIHAKRILDYFLRKCQEDPSVESQFAQQYANLRIMEHKCDNILTSLSAYHIEIKK